MKIRDFTSEQLAGAAKYILHRYDSLFGLDKDYNIAINVHDVDWNNYKVVIHYVQEYNSIGESGTQGYTEQWKTKTFVLDKSSDVNHLELDMYEAIENIVRNPVIHA